MKNLNPAQYPVLTELSKCYILAAISSINTNAIGVILPGGKVVKGFSLVSFPIIEIFFNNQVLI